MTSTEASSSSAERRWRSAAGHRGGPRWCAPGLIAVRGEGGGQRRQCFLGAFDERGCQPHVRRFRSESENYAERAEIGRLRRYAGEYPFI